MRKLMLAILLTLLAVGVLSGLNAHADQWCGRAAAMVENEPVFVLHTTCVPCPDEVCPYLPPPPQTIKADRPVLQTLH